MREKKEARSSPKADWMRRMREQRYEEQQQRGRDAKLKRQEPPAVRRGGKVGGLVLEAEVEPEPVPAFAEGDGAVEATDEDEGWLDLEAESRKAKKGKR